MTENQRYQQAKAVYAELGVDTDLALQEMQDKKISIHCWQGDDGIGFEVRNASVNTGIMATGNFPGRARNAEELRADMSKAMQLIPGKHKFNLHSIYAETNGKKVERDELRYEYFENWVAWAKEKGIGLDFNPTIYNHVNMKEGYSFSSPDESIRKFWIRHTMACREIAARIGKELGQKCVNNIWISDGSKDNCVNKAELRQNLKNSLDEIFKVKYDPLHMVDALEPKLFGIGTESFVVGSLEFYLSYALLHHKLLCLDMGHYHPTELVSEKISSLLTFMDELLLHVSRGVRWDSDHVVTYTEELQNVFNEIQRMQAFPKVNIALDFFDASIDRVGAWVIGARNTLKAILVSFLEPTELLRRVESAGDWASRLAYLEECKSLPFGVVWDRFCEMNNVPVREKWIPEMKEYEARVLALRQA